MAERFREPGGAPPKAGEGAWAGLEILLSREEIQRRVRELGAQITADYEGRDLVLVCLLKGAAFFLADLSRAIDLPVTVEFLRAASYGDRTSSSGEVRIEEIDGVELAGKDVILVEDIVDSGLTLARVLAWLRSRETRSTEVCSLLYKDRGVEHPFSLRYIGFRIENRFVVGYGLDYGERYRNLPCIAALRE
jgi:hypoxanthine phosphoribosyltransferase